MPHPLIWIAAPALEAMEEEARRRHPDETGGMLLGWHNPDLDEAVVTAVIGPGPEAVHRRSSFTPQGSWQQLELERTYEEKRGGWTYLGDWHVHPRGGFGMSRRDRLTMAKTVHAPEARLPYALMVLLAGTDDGYRVGAWTLDRPKWFGRPGAARQLTVRTFPP